MVAVPVIALNGAEDGPGIFVAAAIHGDEICGVEIIREVLGTIDPSEMRGHLLAVPIVNVHGFVAGDRYLPDRRDLNRSFPGSPRGSLASRLAALFMAEVVTRCDVGIDLHTGSNARSNSPQIRADLSDGPTSALADLFAPPVILNAPLRRGSLRDAVARTGRRVVVYEAGEALRFNDEAIAEGVGGVLRVMKGLDMIDQAPEPGRPTRVATASTWVRAPMSGLLTSPTPLGADVAKREIIATVVNAIGTDRRVVRSPVDGIIIGRTEVAVVHRADALFHIAEI